MDLTTWLTKNEVAAAIGCSTKTVERHAERRDLTKRMRPRPGLQSEVVYDPSDVAALKARLAEARAAELEKVSPALREDEAGNSDSAALMHHLSATRQAGITRGQDIAQMFMTILAEASTHPVPIQNRYYLSYSDASKLSGLSVDTLRKAVADGRIKTMPYGNGVRLRRKDLEEL